MTGSEIGRLRGHRGAVKCIQVEANLCLTGAEDGSVRLWDLRLVDEDDWDRDSLADVAEEDEGTAYDGELVEKPNGIRSSEPSEAGTADQTGPCIRLFEGHSKAVTALYFEDECLVNFRSFFSSMSSHCACRSLVPRIRLFVNGTLQLDSVS
jgi:division protein 1